MDLARLALKAERGRDYRVTVVDHGASVTVAAIHGGYIEPLTGTLAAAVAGADHNLYEFEALHAEASERLRIPFARFDDLRLRALMERSVAGLSVDGVPGDSDATVHLGGANRTLLRRLAASLKELGYEIAGPATTGAAHSPRRFVNRAEHGGVQMELPARLRQSMVSVPLTDPGWQDPAAHTPRFSAFVRAVRDGLDAYIAGLRADLGEALERFERTTEQVRRAIPLDPTSDDVHHRSRD